MNDSLYERFSKRPRGHSQERRTKENENFIALKEGETNLLAGAGGTNYLCTTQWLIGVNYLR